MRARGPARRFIKRCAFAALPPALMRYQIALRNYRRGEPEIHLLKELVDPLRQAVDVGAYQGAYTYFLQRLAAHVHVFEPQQHCARFLRRAYRRGVTVHDCALAEMSGTGTLVKPHPDGHQSARLSLALNGPSNAETVVVKSLDDFPTQQRGFYQDRCRRCRRECPAGRRTNDSALRTGTTRGNRTAPYRQRTSMK